MKLNRRFREFLRDEVNLNPDILRRLQTSVRDVNAPPQRPAARLPENRPTGFLRAG